MIDWNLVVAGTLFALILGGLAFAVAVERRGLRGLKESAFDVLAKGVEPKDRPDSR